jgi:hypothetical protein
MGYVGFQQAKGWQVGQWVHPTPLDYSFLPVSSAPPYMMGGTSDSQVISA